jgi:hypothetical protein
MTLILNITELPDCCSNAGLDLLHKAGSGGPENDLWKPHPNPLLWALIEPFHPARRDPQGSQGHPAGPTSDALVL